MRYLAVDLGDRRSGLAVGDDETGVVTPAGTIEAAPEALLDAVAAAVAEHEPDAVVVGLPLNMDGTEGPRARLARDFGEKLAAAADLPVHYQDERLTSFAAEQQMAGGARTRRQRRFAENALAAAEILRDFLRARSGGV